MNNEIRNSKYTLKNRDSKLINQPYQFEPPARQRIDVESSSGSDEYSESDRDELNVDEWIDNVVWCSCEHCVAFLTAEESRCCREYAELEEKLDQQQFSCITFNDGFIGNCLNPDVIEVSFYEFLQSHGPIGDEEPIHEVYRYIAYRRLARWLWNRLRKHERRPLPSCAVAAIRRRFLSKSYTGFQYADHEL